MEANPRLEFEFFLAETLGCTVAEIRLMSNQEFVGWTVYFGRKAQRREMETQRAKGR